MLKVLCLPHPYRAPKDEECLLGGVLYRDLDVVNLPGRGEELVGQEGVGRVVWESLEKGVEEWEKEEKDELKKIKKEVKEFEQSISEKEKPDKKPKDETTHAKQE